MNRREYAVVDIETTGGSPKGSKITEIAVLIHNGSKVITYWETLINPQQQIPLHITTLTGITNEMVSEAPLFQEIAEQLIHLLANRIFVAHNVNFDYSFVRHQLQEVGLVFTAKKLCTVRATRKIFPGLASYSLGNLCRSLDIAVTNRHRAGGDAKATAVLLTKLIEEDSTGEIEHMLKKSAADQRLPPNLPLKDFESLPNQPGVYYFYNAHKKVIYVGKAVNLKKRVTSHFTGHKINAQRQHFLRDIYGISFEVCATELMAFLLEYAEIKKLWPIYNTALKKFEPKFGLYEYTGRNGYRYLTAGKVTKLQSCIEIFGRVGDAVNMLSNLKEKFNLDYRFCKFAVTSYKEGIMQKDTSNLPTAASHNERVQQAVNFVRDSKPSYIILDKGRTNDEKSCIYIKDGHFYGMGYIPNDVVVTDGEHVQEFLKRDKSSSYIMQLISAYAYKHPNKIIRTF